MLYALKEDIGYEYLKKTTKLRKILWHCRAFFSKETQLYSNKFNKSFLQQFQERWPEHVLRTYDYETYCNDSLKFSTYLFSVGLRWVCADDAGNMREDPGAVKTTLY